MLWAMPWFRSAILALLAAALPAEQVITAGDRYEVVELPDLRVFVPRDHAVLLAPTIARAAAAYRIMARDAGYATPPHLELVLADDSDNHNGFSTVLPIPLTLVWQAPAWPTSTIFDGDDPLYRTLIHEFAHHLSNERTTDPIRSFSRSLFGRVVPSDPLSLLVFLGTTPGHVLQPSFWQEGLAQWAETAYADPGSVWAGRGRDPLVHMAWRMDAEQGKLPEVADWRLSYHRWPFGNRSYLYGLAYTRWLAAHDRGANGRANSADLWALSLSLSGQAPFVFDSGSRPLLGVPHTTLIEQARQDLITEQQAALAIIRSQPVTVLPRLTPAGWSVAIPAWMADGRLAMAVAPENASRRLVAVDAKGDWENLRNEALSGGAVRRLVDGSLILQEGRFDWVGHRRIGISLRLPDNTIITVYQERLVQPDVRAEVRGDSEPRWLLVALALRPGASTALIRARFAANGTVSDAVDLPVQGRAWSPALRPGTEELCWVETDRDGSRLVFGSLGLPGSATTAVTTRRILWQVRGRILHPVWSADGSRIFVASDVSGVANAWCVAVDGSPARPVSNVTGGVLACVPSPDGRELALINHDVDGPYLARIPLDERTWPSSLPQVQIPWPAPGGSGSATAAVRPLSLTADPAEVPAAVPYHGLPLVRPLFWTPTTTVTPYGGIGVVAVATDPLGTHQVVASLGIAEEGNVVARGLYAYTGWPIQFGILGQRNELTWDSSYNPLDYTETETGVALLAGRRVGYFDRSTFTAYMVAGINHRAPDPDDRALTEPTALLPAFAGDERYLEAVVGFDTRQAYPADYAPRDGVSLLGSIRRIGFGGDRDGWRARVDGSAAWAPIPSLGHQLVAGGAIGWSHEEREWLQGEFGIGGDPALTLPRGYDQAVATGDNLLGWSLAWRAPLWRPFVGWSTSPFRLRQIVAEAFYEGAKVSDDQIGGDGDWYRSVGGELRANLEFSIIDLNPGLGVAHQLDDEESDVAYFTMDFRW